MREMPTSGRRKSRTSDAAVRAMERIRKEFGSEAMVACFSPKASRYVVDTYGIKIARGLLRHHRRKWVEARSRFPDQPPENIPTDFDTGPSILEQFEEHLKRIEAARRSSDRKLPKTLVVLRRGSMPFELARNIARLMEEKLENSPRGPKTNVLEVIKALDTKEVDDATHALELAGKAGLSALHYMPSQIGATAAQIHELFRTGIYAGRDAEDVRRNAHIHGIQWAINANRRVAAEKDLLTAEQIERKKQAEKAEDRQHDIRIKPNVSRTRFEGSQSK